MDQTADRAEAAADAIRPPYRKIAYLAPELPALSATFVYEELLALERRGFSVLPISVRRPTTLATEQAALSARTLCVYEGPVLALVGQGLLGLAKNGKRALTALRWLISDIAEVGWTRATSWKLAYQLLAGVRLAAMLKDNGCAHLHVHFAHVPAQIAMYASALAGVPFTIMAHANDIFERGLLLRRKAERASRMLTISEHNLHYLERVGIPHDRLAVVRCGVSFPVGARPVRPGARRSVTTIGTLGRMVEKKGFDVLIRALAELKSSGRSIELQIAGDGPLRTELEGLARQLGLAQAIRFVGSLPHDQVAKWMGQLDAFVLACKQDSNGDMDGIPVVLMEAMSQSLPVISTRLSGIPELVIHDETGLLAQPDDHIDLARQIVRLIESPRLAEEISRRGCQHVAAEFGQENNVERLVGHFGRATMPAPSDNI